MGVKILFRIGQTIQKDSPLSLVCAPVCVRVRIPVRIRPCAHTDAWVIRKDRYDNTKG